MGKSGALDGEIIKLGEGVAIYKTVASQFYQARIWDSARKRYIVRSTKESSRIKARAAAWEIQRDLLNGQPKVDREYTFSYYADRLIEKGNRLVANGERNKNYNRTMKLFLDNDDWGLVRRFGIRDVRHLKTRDYQEFIDELSKRRSDLSTSTRNMLMSTFRNVMKVARDDGVVDAVPATPRTRQKDNPRAFFQFSPLVPDTDDECHRLLNVAEILGQERTIVRGVPITYELRDIILFVLNSFVRPTVSELFALKHSDISVSNMPKQLVLRIRNGKTGFRYAVTMPAAVDLYEAARARFPNHQKEDYVFCPHYSNRETAGKIVQRQFRVVVQATRLTPDPNGAPYTMYSLRHTAICMRLVQSEGNVNIYNLAKNAGTSVSQIERFYASKLPPTAQMAKNLQLLGKDFEESWRRQGYYGYVGEREKQYRKHSGRDSKPNNDAPDYGGGNVRSRNRSRKKR